MSDMVKRLRQQLQKKIHMNVLKVHGIVHFVTTVHIANNNTRGVHAIKNTRRQVVLYIICEFLTMNFIK